jgi:carboxyl-terminal processing protease
MQFKKTISALALGVVIGVSGTMAQGVMADRPQQAQAELPLEHLRAFSEVYARIKRDYVDEVDDKTLLEAAVRGMLSGLDPHSSYMGSKEYQNMRVGTRGEFGGIGIEVGTESGFVKVIAPIDDTPAHAAGVQAGDLIVRLDGRSTKDLPLNEAVQMMRGAPGTDLKLTINRPGLDKPLELTLTRANIQVQSVRARMLEPGFGYVRISQFQTRTGDNFKEALERLKSEAGGNLNGLVLDLRNNPGGVLRASVEVADALLNSGRIVYTEGRMNNEVVFNAKPNDMLDGAPIVVLVNGGSASASEIVAGALQDHKRAIIMGSQTFGKGSVQSILPMQDGTAVKLTTARYFTPSGRSIQAKGITPDMPVDQLQVARAEDQTARVREADLRGHLQSGEKPASMSTVGGEDLATRDFPLHEAVNLLRGLHILSMRNNNNT